MIYVVITDISILSFGRSSRIIRRIYLKKFPLTYTDEGEMFFRLHSMMMFDSIDQFKFTIP